MNAITLILLYLAIAAIGQALGIIASRGVEGALPGYGGAFAVIVFMGMLWAAWPIAVRLHDRWEARIKTAHALRKPDTTS
jgi:hypothetical protein